MSKFEQVVTIRRSCVADKLPEQFGVVPQDNDEKELVFNQFFKPEEVVIGSRHWLETDENFLQLIPCCVFRKPDGTVFTYQRAKGTVENRLLGNTSCNIGGHVNLSDMYFADENGGDIDIKATIWQNIVREVYEELGVRLDEICIDEIKVNLDKFTGIIYDDSNSVGRVHIGLLFVFDVPQDTEFDLNTSEGLANGNWNTPEAILFHDTIDAITLENWAKIALQTL